MANPTVAIVGRPNVGKSTLFNRLAGRRTAIVDDIPGTTRDRLYAAVTWGEREFTLADTGGLEVLPASAISRHIKAQVEKAIAEADAVIFLVDGKDGLVSGDEDIAQVLRQSGKPVVLAVNKAENLRRQEGAVEFYRLGMGEPLPLSAYHGRGVGELLDRLLPLLPEVPPPTPEAPAMKVAIVGRPNVGKSTLFNAMVGEERALVDEAPGTTRDAVDTLITFQGKPVLLIDTAGLRRRGKIEPGVEKFSLFRAMGAINRCDVALLVTEGPAGVHAQDVHIAGYIHQAYKGIVLVVNKWDLTEVRDPQANTAQVREALKFMPYTPILFVSAKLGWGIEGVLPAAEQVYQERLKLLPSERVKEAVLEAVSTHRPPTQGPRAFQVFSASQVAVNPPTFLFRVNDPKLLHFSYQRYLENRLRQAFGFQGTPLRLVFRAGREQ